MRSDQNLNPRFLGSAKWTFQRGSGGEVKNVIRNPDGSENVWTAFSHSGKERNRLFLNQKGQGFINASSVSGADSILDGRSFVHWDFNRDGLPDLALVNANGNLLQVFENEITTGGNFVAVRLEGSAGREQGGSNRDGIGARVMVEAGGMQILRVLSAGEGFANANGRTLLIGIGKAERVDQARVLWPSGKVTVLGEVSSGELIQIDEIEGLVDRRKYVVNPGPSS